MIFKSAYVTLFIAIANLINPSLNDKAMSGTASFYAKKFEGKRTSSGQRYRDTQRTAAHRTYPFGTLLEITNKDNGLKTIVRVNDRGPYLKSRLIDLSYLAAKDLKLVSSGIAEVSMKVISLGKLTDIQQIEAELTQEKNKIASEISTFMPDFLKKEYQYMIVQKLADGNSNILFSDIRPK